ncbi:DUF5709 domain-containing protein [Amycolatopsis acidiphila]|uniref:DUF5709 domain-containing protein n=1 Tax=Amycolatopsis acidiphila TaxID=715473 RepID=A0A557ZZ36_9PSEU|nr:DUF5709 domain-containing protein [Amycolatopsis acidiphila]TVT17264.1 hypothetical protein FNH06_32205 [Amycolatopsis acidiphila]UIJ62955.1 DUF5709 domain-containing protein [Amycolatopsis acidiphila]GHG65270.1 hypothetical protein GCM10017788_22640 [Amycolatopsis acidiphila]
MAEPRSEQQESLELEAEPKPLEDPVSWRATDPDYAREPDAEDTGNQFVAPDRANDLVDREKKAVADDAGTEHPAAGAEEQAMHVEDGGV